MLLYYCTYNVLRRSVTELTVQKSLKSMLGRTDPNKNLSTCSLTARIYVYIGAAMNALFVRFISLHMATEQNLKEAFYFFYSVGAWQHPF